MNNDMRHFLFKLKAISRAIGLLIYSPVWIAAHLVYFIARVLLMLAYIFMLEGKKAKDIYRHLI